LKDSELTKMLKPFGLCCICGDNKTTVYDYCGQVVDVFCCNVSGVTKVDIQLLVQQYKKESKIRKTDKTHECNKQGVLF